jgi:small GTP-binding protein
MTTKESYYYQFRLILIGSTAVGKTSIFGRIKDPNYFCANLPNTVGVNPDLTETTVQVDGKTIKILLADTAGQERFRSIVKSYYRNMVGGFLVFDVRDHKTFEELNEWLEDAKEGAANPRELTFVLVGNKIDKDVNQPRSVSYQEAKAFAEHFGMEYIETSAKTGQNIDELLPFLVNKVY